MLAAKPNVAAHTRLLTRTASTHGRALALLCTRQRKPTWTAADVARFSELLQAEHATQATEASARKSLLEAEEAVDGGLVAFVDALRERYQQEQARLSVRGRSVARCLGHRCVLTSCTRADSRAGVRRSQPASGNVRHMGAAGM